MKTRNILLIFTLAAAFFIVTPGCKVVYPKHKSGTVVIKSNHRGKIPPGQAKKVTGAKSAKKYAPGQNKRKK